MIFAVNDPLVVAAIVAAIGSAIVALFTFATSWRSRGDLVLDKALQRLEADNERMHEHTIPEIQLALKACEDREVGMKERIAALERAVNG